MMVSKGKVVPLQEVLIGEEPESNILTSCSSYLGQQEAEPPSTWRHAFYKFTQDTTFHGFRYVTESTSYLLRR